MTLFNHSLHFSEPIYGCDPLSFHKQAQNGGFEYYETRAHGCSKVGDVIQLDPNLQHDYPFAQEHYRQIGLETCQEVVWNLSANAANDYRDHHFSVYLFTEQINTLRPDPARLDATLRYLNKNSFMQLCQGKAPTPKTVFGDTAQTAVDFDSIKLPVYVKGAVSSGGSSSYRCETPGEVEQAIAKLMHGPYQVQEDVNPVAFLSVLYDISAEGTLRHITKTQQIIDGVDYIGSSYPTSYNPKSVTDVIANQAVKDGLKGKLGFDVAVNANGQFFVLECNPRWTGALYPLVIAKRLGADEWSTVHLPTRSDRLQDIVLGDLAFNPNRKTGAVLVNWGAIKNLWVELLLIGPPAAQQTLLAQLSANFAA